MTDDGNAPTVPTVGPTGSEGSNPPATPDLRYAIRGLLGRGGMGEVWLAHDRRIDREIAIKLMRGASSGDPDAVARFLREARVQGRLEHPAIAPVHDLGGDPAPFFAMKRVTGTTLADVLAAKDPGTREKWTRAALLARLVDACFAIELAHRNGVVHRDLKPANLMLGELGEVYVLDWGLAKIVGGEEISASSLALATDSSSGQTVAGAMLGTVGYMPPEQMRGEQVDARSDIFALGCILFEILVGEAAVPRETAYKTTLEVASHRPSLRRPDADVPPELDDLCARATAADPVNRIASAREFADAIQRFLDGDRDLERRRTLAGEHAKRAEAATASLGVAVPARREADERADAMREAGRALALDPENARAKELLARLLLEPPRELPDEVRTEIDVERDTATQRALRKMAIMYAVFCVQLPLAFALGALLTWRFVLLGVCALATTLSIAIISRRVVSATFGRVALMLGLHLATLTAASLYLGPLLIVPVVAVGSGAMVHTVPSIHTPRIIFVAHALPVLVPFALEAFGVIAKSYTIDSGRLLLTPHAIGIGAEAMIFITVITVILQMVATTVVLSAQRAYLERAQEQLHVQSWHLKQLVR